MSELGKKRRPVNGEGEEVLSETEDTYQEPNESAKTSDEVEVSNEIESKCERETSDQENESADEEESPNKLDNLSASPKATLPENSRESENCSEAVETVEDVAKEFVAQVAENAREIVENCMDSVSESKTKSGNNEDLIPNSEGKLCDENKHVEEDRDHVADQSARKVAAEDRKNPAFVPRSGQFYLHDTRDGEEGNEVKGEEAEDEEVKEVEDPETKKAALQLKIKNDAWGHDLYDDQAPLSTEEIIDKYGYDIRAHPPDAPPPVKFDRGSNRGRQGYGRPDRRQQRNDFFQPKQQQLEEKTQRGSFTDNRRMGGSRRQNEHNGGRPIDGRSNTRSNYRDRDNYNSRYQSDAKQPFDRDFPPLPQKSTNGEERNQNASYTNRDFVKSSERPRRGRGGGAGYGNDKSIPQQSSFSNGWKSDRRMGNDDRMVEQPKPYAHVKRVTNQPPLRDQGKFQRGGFHENGNRPPPNRNRNKLPEWATEDPPDAMWEPEAEEPHSMRPQNQGPAHFQQQQHHSAPSRQTTTFYNRNFDQQSQGQHGHRYSSMRNNVRQQETSPKNTQSQKSRFQNQRESPMYRKDDGDYDDYDSQGEADWQGLESPAKVKSPLKPAPQRIANQGPPVHHQQNGGTDSSKPTQQQGADATAIAAATIQQLLSNPGLLQQLLVAATASSNAASSSATPAVSASMTTTNAPSQHQVHHQHSSQAHQYRQPVASYYHPHSVAAPQPATSTPSASEFLNNMTPQQAAAFQAAALNMFSGSAPPNAGQALPAGFMAPSAAASAGTAYYFQSPEANATHHFVAATATPPQATMRHGHHPNR